MQVEKELKARLMAEMEAEIEKLLEEAGDRGTVTLSEIERAVEEAGRRIEQRLIERLVAEAAEAQGQEQVHCPRCGGKLRYKGRKRRWVATSRGEVEIERGYFYCETCRQGFFPLDERWELTDSLYSPGLAQQMVWLSGMLPSYEAAAEVFRRVSGRLLPAVSLWRQTQRYGERLAAYVKHQQEQVSPQRVVLPGSHEDHPRQKGVSLDGGMVNLRQEGWKEFKVGTVFDVEQRLERDPVTRELVEQPHGVHIAYTAVLGAVEQFAPALWALAVRHAVPQAAHSSVTADGAEWIWNLAADYFPDSAQIVDWYHACQHLAEAATALYPHDSQAAQRWYQQRRDDLFQGHIHPITLPLDRAGLSDQAHYFHTHQRRLQYQQFREEGYPIGSGTVESGIKQFKARMTGPGMRWNRPNAERMLVIRAAVLSGDFDHLWALAA